MKETKTHWKKLTNPNYLGAYSLDPGEERVIEIVSVQREMVQGSDGKKEECTVATLKDSKPMILNATNCKALHGLFKSPYIEDWKGKRAIVFAMQVKAFGEVVDALRIKPGANVLPTLDEKNPKWPAIVKAIVTGTHKYADIEKIFELTPENKLKLEGAVSDYESPA